MPLHPDYGKSNPIICLICYELANGNYFKYMQVGLQNGLQQLISSYVEILDVFVPFEINRKSLLNKITAALEKNATTPEHYEETMHFLREFELFAKNVISCGYNILMIESTAKKKIDIEKRLIIDEDLCEIY